MPVTEIQQLAGDLTLGSAFLNITADVGKCIIGNLLGRSDRSDFLRRFNHPHPPDRRVNLRLRNQRNLGEAFFESGVLRKVQIIPFDRRRPDAMSLEPFADLLKQFPLQNDLASMDVFFCTLVITRINQKDRWRLFENQQGTC